MQITMNKRGLSGVVVAVILIAVSIAATTLLYVQISPFLNLSPQTKCAELQLGSPVFIQKACYNAETKDLELTLKRTLDRYEIKSLEFDILSDTASSRWNCGLCGDCKLLGEGEEKTYYLAEDDKDWKTVKISADSCLLERADVTPC